MKMNMSVPLKLLILTLLSGVFLSLALHKLDVPGYQTDEGFYTVPAMNMMYGTSMDEAVVSKIHIGRITLPVMSGTYIGSTQIYLLLPFIKLFGPHFTASRIMPIFFACLVLWLTWMLCEALFNWRIALMSTALLACNPSYILWSRIGLQGEGPLLVFLFLSSLLFLMRWYTRGGQLSLYSAAFLLGVGLYTKLNFIFLIIALAFSAALFAAELSAKIRGRHTLIAGGFFLLGVFPLLYYNITEYFPTVHIIIDSVFDGSYGGENNAHIIANGILRIKQFIALLGGGAYYTTHMKTPNPWYALMFFISFAGLAAIIIKKGLRSSRKIVVILVMDCLIFAGNCFTVSGFYIHHLFLLFPFPLITIVLFWDALAERVKSIQPIVLAVALILFISADISVLFGRYRYFEKTGERAEWSDSIYRLSDYLEKHNIRHPVTLDDRIKFNTEVLTQGGVSPVVIVDIPVERTIALLKHSIVRGDYFIVLSPLCNTRRSQASPYTDLFETAKAERCTLALVQTFSNRVNEPVYYLYKTQPAAGAHRRPREVQRIGIDNPGQ